MTSIQPPTRRLAGLLYAALLSSVLPAQANGFADLQAALARQQSLVPVKGSFRIETWTRQGDGKDGSEQQEQGEAGAVEGLIHVVWMITRYRFTFSRKNGRPEGRPNSTSRSVGEGGATISLG